jgi:hypothetical protein
MHLSIEQNLWIYGTLFFITILCIINLVISISIASFVLGIGDFLKSRVSDLETPVPTSLSGLKDVQPLDRKVERQIVTTRRDDDGKVIEREVENI